MQLLEREQNLAALSAALAQARTGSGCMALVSGEAGIGKTSLVNHFVQAECPPARLLWGACDALITPRPLGPVHDMAKVAHPELRSLVQHGADWQAIAAAMLAELQRAGAPVVVIFEDVHWADEATLDLMRYLGRRVRQTYALLILTFRDDEVGPRHPLRLVIGDLATSPALHRVQLVGLSEAAVRQLSAGREVDPVALYTQTGGNPFYVTEVLAGTGTGIPATVRDAVLARAARLSASGRAILEAAAVIGLRVEPWLLAEMAGAESIALEECIDVGMLKAQGEYVTFRHDIARQTILETLMPTRKLVLNQLVLAALRKAPATRNELARLADHAEAAGDAEAVLACAPAAATQAIASNAHREAAAQYARALRFAGGLPPAEQAKLLDAYATECRITDQFTHAVAARQ
jgi:predicted ATPase